MTEERLSLGRAGEEAAVRLLQKKGMRIVERNFRCRMGELDIVARDGPYLVFVEVRTVTGSAFGTAQESVNDKKKRKLRQLAMYYIQRNKAACQPARFDVVGVVMGQAGGVLKIDHIVNAF